MDSAKQPLSSDIKGEAVSSPAAAAAQDSIAVVGPGRPAVKVGMAVQGSKMLHFGCLWDILRKGFHCWVTEWAGSQESHKSVCEL